MTNVNFVLVDFITAGDHTGINTIGGLECIVQSLITAKVCKTDRAYTHMGCADMLSVLSMTPMQDNPKSVSLTCPWLEMSRLSGFRSRWMMACMHDNHGEQTHSNIT